MADELKELQAELNGYEEQLDVVQSSLQSDPDNVELTALKTELESALTLLRDGIDELTSTITAPPAPKPASKKSPTEPEKWSKEKHPAYQAGYRKPGSSEEQPGGAPPAQQQQTYKVNDTVLAKWVSGDKSFYPARITSVTGSAAAPVYYVKFKSYDTTETLRGGDIRPLQNRKRGFEESSASPAAPSPATSFSGPAGPDKKQAGVISASPAIDAKALENNQSQRASAVSKASDGPARPAKVAKKIKNKKELETGKAKWQEFAAKNSKGSKAARKESMFRTGSGVGARVGFTGSGQEMRKHDQRSRYTYRPEDEDD